MAYIYPSILGIYLSIPKGYRFQAGSREHKISDCFINDEGEILALQSIVQDALQNKQRYADKYTDKGVTMYYKHSPSSEAYFLRYLPANNGKYPSIEKPELVIGLAHCLHARRIVSKKPEPWVRSIMPFFTEEKKRIIKKKRQEKRNSLRKIGDSPAAN